MKNRVFVCLVSLAALCGVNAVLPLAAASSKSDNGPQLKIVGKNGAVAGFVPLRHTSVKTEISGFVARISVTQEFENVLPNAVEAIYVFPLPHDSAVDGMTMRVGDREIRAVIHEREEARKIYEAARSAGHTTALLDQERPNIFTQSVANIPPNSKVEVNLSVIELLKYEAGTYEFAFPLVVGPRYIPGASKGQNQPAQNRGAKVENVSFGSGTDGDSDSRGTMADTNQVQDASRISPPVAGIHTDDAHAGHDVSMEVNLAAGVPIVGIHSTSHKILADRTAADAFHVQLAADTVLPKKDFILKYKVAGQGIGDALLTHADHSGGYFAFILQPPDRVLDGSTVPRQVIFVLDTSGSMDGFPLEMAKKTIRRALDNLRPEETFNLITFSGDTRILFPEPVPPTQENIAAAKTVLDGAYGSGGTEMMGAIRAALGDGEASPKPAGGVEPVRVVCFMTDGYVGNDAEIVAEVQKHPEARVFSFGIGTAVNRFLLSKMAEAGRGEVEFVTKSSEAQGAADRFYERVHSPVLINVSIEWNGLPVSEVLPTRIPDLFSAKPVIITGRYAKAGKGTLVIRGTQAGGPFRREIAVDFGAENAGNAVLEKIWARRKVDDYMSQDWMGIQQGQSKYKAEIVQVGLAHSLATQYTSFVAVETRTVVQDGKPVRIEVPVELPEHVSPLAVPGQGQVTNTFSGAQLQRFAGMVENQGLDQMALYVPGVASKPEYGRSAGSVVKVITKSGTNAAETVEVEAEAPLVETAKAQVTHTIDGVLLNPSVDDSQAEGIIDAAKRRSREAQEKRVAARARQFAVWRSKMSPDLWRLYVCSTMSSVAQTESKCNLPRSGTVAVQVQLSAATAEIAEKLSKAGMTVKTGSGSALVTGQIPIAKLELLAQLVEVTMISPIKE
ncbi:MAG TPA: VIT domain-containing protein [Candidatus Angelobacter sp.]|jgi:Ca-activated chloride channel family protein|nr:VIT domain-containing protein [Candidatus Angelobacter sp.]